MSEGLRLWALSYSEIYSSFAKQTAPQFSHVALVAKSAFFFLILITYYSLESPEFISARIAGFRIKKKSFYSVLCEEIVY